VLGELPRELVYLGVKLELGHGIIDRFLFLLDSIVWCLIELEALSRLCHLSRSLIDCRCELILQMLLKKFVLNLLPLSLLIVLQALFKLALDLLDQLLRDQLLHPARGSLLGGLICGLVPVLLFKVSEHLLLFLQLVFEAALEGFGNSLTHLGCTGRPLRLKGAQGGRVGCRVCVIVAVLGQPLSLFLPHLANNHEAVLNTRPHFFPAFD